MYAALARKQQPYYAHSKELLNTEAPKDDFSCNKLIKHWRRLDGFETVGLLTPIAHELLPSTSYREKREMIGEKRKEKSKNLLGQIQ